MPAMIKSVAVIGVGTMGAPIARSILAGGFEVIVCDRSEDALRQFDGESVRTTTRAADCVAADLVLILVVTADQVRDVVFGDNGLVSGLSSERSPLLAVMSTVGRNPVVELEQQLAPHGVHLIEAPISGGPARADSRTLSVMIGGDAPDAATAKPVFACLGPEVFHCGPVGAAQTVKIGNNILGMINTYAAAEVYRLMIEQGLDLAEATPVIDVSTGRNWLSARSGEAATSFKAFTASRHMYDGLNAIMRKDAALGLELLAGSDGSFPVIEGISALVNSLGEETFDNWQVVAGAAED
jgi:3-hydroxyisobutyrate dehydrogenase